MSPLKPWTIKPTSGGALISAFSLENVGEANYVEKDNWRRIEMDREAIREGDVYFYPNKSLPIGVQPLHSSFKVTQLCEVKRPNGERSILAFTQTQIRRFNFALGEWQLIGSGFSPGRRWQVEEVNGYAVLNNSVDLPCTFRHEESVVNPIYELREAGIASVGVICVFAGFLLLGDITEIRADKLVSFMNGPLPYGLVPAADCNRIRYKVAWSEWGEPRRWAPIIPATVAEKGKVATLAFPVHSETLSAGAKIAVIGGDINGGTLGGQEGAEEGLPVLSVSGTTVTWDVAETAVDGAYPMQVSICRFADLSTISGYSAIQDDSSGILGMLPLGTSLCIYRDTSIWVARYTGVKESPFVFREVYKGEKTLYYQNTLVGMGDYHLFASAGQFFKFDGSGEPTYAEVLNFAKNVFFDGLDISQTDSAFAARNSLTNEVWFCQPQRILAFDYQFNTCSKIDVPYTACAMVTRPKASHNETRLDEKWFIMAVDGAIVQYGLTNEGFKTYQRREQPYTCTLRSGLWSMGRESDRKDIRVYAPQLSTDSATAMCRIKVFGCATPDEAPRLLFDVTRNNRSNEVHCLFQEVFFQDELSVTTHVDAGVRFSSRTFKGAIVASRWR